MSGGHDDGCDMGAGTASSCSRSRDRAARCSSWVAPLRHQRHTDAVVTVLTVADAIRISGADPRYARVLRIETADAGELDAVGLVLIDSNSDGAHVEAANLYLDDTGRWQCQAIGSVGGVPNGYLGAHMWGEYHLPGRASPSVEFAYGQADQPGGQEVLIGDRPVRVDAGDNRWWAWINPVLEDNEDAARARALMHAPRERRRADATTTCSTWPHC